MQGDIDFGLSTGVTEGARPVCLLVRLGVVSIRSCLADYMSQDRVIRWLPGFIARTKEYRAPPVALPGRGNGVWAGGDCERP